MEMRTPQLETLINLVTIDTSLKKLKQERLHFEGRILSLRSNIESLQNEVKKHHLRVKEEKKRADDCELRIQELEQEIKHKKNRLESLTSPKEYNSINAELNILKISQQECEEQLIDAWHHIDSALKQEELFRQKSEIQKKEYEQEIQTIKSSIEQTFQLHNRLESERKELIKHLPQEWADRYERMHLTVENPVVPVENGICSACSYYLIGSDINQLKRGSLIECRSCFRFIYLPV